MKIAVPTLGGKLCSHFGHCEKFAIIDVADNNIVDEVFISPPAHEPGVFPAWLKEQGVDIIIAGGIGQRAQQIFLSHNIKVVAGVTPETPKTIVNLYIKGKLESGDNLCDH